MLTRIDDLVVEYRFHHIPPASDPTRREIVRTIQIPRILVDAEEGISTRIASSFRTNLAILSAVEMSTGKAPVSSRSTACLQRTPLRRVYARSDRTDEVRILLFQLEKSNEAPSPPTADSVLSTRLPLSDYVCRSPHCRTPDVPLADFESGIMEPILIRLALSYCHEAVDDVKSSLLQREFADARLLERLILRFCCEGDSFATVVRKLGSVEVRKKLDQAVDDIFDEEMRAQEGKPSLSSLLFESLQYLLNAGFNLIEQTVQIARSKGDRATAFCLHHVQQNRTMLEAIVKQKRPREDRKFVTCNVSSLWLEIRAGMLSGRIAGDGWTLEERSESDLISEFAEGFDRAGECHSRVSDRIDHCWTRAIELVGAGPPLSDFLQVYCDSSTPFLDSTLLQQLSYDVKRMDLCRCSACIPGELLSKHQFRFSTDLISLQYPSLPSLQHLSHPQNPARRRIQCARPHSILPRQASIFPRLPILSTLSPNDTRSINSV